MRNKNHLSLILSIFVLALTFGCSNPYLSYEDLQNESFQEINSSNPDSFYYYAKNSVISAPFNVKATKGVSEVEVIIEWDAVDAASKYRVYRSSSIDGTYELLKNDVWNDGNVRTNIYHDTFELSAGKDYFYRITSVMKDGKESSKSGAVIGYTSAGSLPSRPVISSLNMGPESNCIILKWEAIEGARSYEIIRYTGKKSEEGWSINDSEFKIIASNVCEIEYFDYMAPEDTQFHYFYSVRAYNSSGLHGEDSSFKEGFLPEVPRELRPTEGISKPSYKIINITWGSVADASGYRLYRSEKKSGPWNLIKEFDANGRQYTDSEVVPYTTYYYTVSSLLGNTESMKCNPRKGYAVDSKAPTSPSSIHATKGLHSYRESVHVYWDQVAAATAYKVYKSTSMEGSYSFLAKVTTPFMDDEVEPGKRFFYKVSSLSITTNSEGKETAYEGGPSSSVEGYTLLKPENVNVSVSVSSLDISWDLIVYDPQDVGLNYFRVFRADCPDMENFDPSTAAWEVVSPEVLNIPGEAQPMSTSSTARITFSDESVELGKGYAYRVCSFLSEDEVSGYSSIVTAKTLASPVLTVEGIKRDSVQLRWDAVEGASAYKIYRSNELKGDYPLLVQMTKEDFEAAGSLFTDESQEAASGTSYYYRASALFASGEESGLCRPVEGYALVPPTDISASNGAFSDKIVLVWNSVKGAASYKIMRREHGADESGWAPLIQDLTVNRHDDLKELTASHYDYRIYSVNGDTESSVSAVISGRIAGDGDLLPPIIESTTKGSLLDGVAVTWKASTPSVDGSTLNYYIFRAESLTGEKSAVNFKLNDETGERVFNTDYDNTSLTYTDKQVTHGLRYYYQVEVWETKTDGTVLKSSLSDISEGFSLGIPTGVSASDATAAEIDGKHGVKVAWTAVPGAHHYGIFRFTDAEGSGETKLTEDAITDPFFLDQLEESNYGTSFFYGVRAYCSDSDIVGTDLSSLDEGYILASPKNVKAADGKSYGKTVISWDYDESVKYYRVYRSETEDGEFSKVNGKIDNPSEAPAEGMTFGDDTGIAGKVYWYRVKSFIDEERVSQFSSADKGFRLGAPDSVVVLNSGSATESGDKIEVRWTSHMYGVTFNVYRTSAADGQTIEVKSSVAVNDTGSYKFEDANVTVGTPYSYSIEAVNSDNVAGPKSSPKTGKAKMRAPVISAVGPGSSVRGITTSWTSVPGASYYNLYRVNPKNGKIQRVNGRISETTYVDSEMVSSESLYYDYYVVAYNEDDYEGERGESVRSCLKPQAPILTGVSRGEKDKIVLNWQSVTGVSQYRIMRSGNDGKDYAVVEQIVTGTTYEDLSVKDRTLVGELHYTVSAFIEVDGTKYSSDESNSGIGFRAFNNDQDLQTLIQMAIDSGIGSLSGVTGDSDKNTVPVGYVTDYSDGPGYGHKFYINWNFTGYSYRGLIIDDSHYRYTGGRDNEKAFRDSDDFGDYYGNDGYGDDYRKGKIDYNFKDLEKGVATVHKVSIDYGKWKHPPFAHTNYSLTKVKSQY